MLSRPPMRGAPGVAATVPRRSTLSAWRVAASKSESTPDAHPTADRKPAETSAPASSPSLAADAAPGLAPSSPKAQDAATDPAPLPADPPKKKVVVVGAGWAGFGAAKHLSEQGFAVTLIDGSPNPGGLSSGWRTQSGRAVEAGMKGFWKEYPNIFGLVDEMGLDRDAVFTPFTRSGFWNRQGLVTEAPVFSDLPRLPTLLGQFVHTLDLFKGLSLADRLTMFPLFAAVIDYTATPETYRRYDQMTARELFRQYGCSQELYDQVRPCPAPAHPQEHRPAPGGRPPHVAASPPCLPPPRSSSSRCCWWASSPLRRS